MKAFILAAGLGTRLMPLTKDIPKAMVAIKGKPMIGHLIEKLTKSGFNQIVINIHHNGEKIIEYVNNLSFSGAEIFISDERNKLLDTGGGLLKAKNLLENSNDFLVHNVDIYSNIDLREMYLHHKSSNNLVSLAVKERTSSNYLLFDNDNTLCGWYSNTTGAKRIVKEREEYKELAFSGIQVISSEIFKHITEKGKFGVIPMYLRLAKDHNIGAYIHNDKDVLDLGKHESLKKAQSLFV
ncbi:MAG: sugar phosphate nucleotidyltransferase [Bacteroidales bacterium]|jgi:NDP-sugar pyrophosphorylase family protein|nr:sugar phosphate nucleotidyltransferase [Bacteroidales bacterium]MDD4236661.1 sugar phosphate nucleotidyltransferase [Bacteroidales bacterium]MDY0160382.1 sugar phosphate nucleotidyltransferase [Bacteroidales bacterium]